MKHKLLLFSVGICCGLSVAAQSVVGFPGERIGKLSPVKVEMPAKIGAAPVNHARNKALAHQDRAIAGMESGQFSMLVSDVKRMMAKESGKQRLDSLVQKNPDGSNAQRIFCTYDDKGLMTTQLNSFWNADTEQWDPYQKYSYEWNSDGLCLEQSLYEYAAQSGLRYTYKYNDQKLGIEQITYVGGADGVWQESSKGEYKYDAAGNMTEERTYVWGDGKWSEVGHNMATWDAENRQTSYESYEMQDGQWKGTAKEEYDWFTDNKLNYKYMYLWVDETRTWQNAQRWIQDWREDGLLLAQRMRYWNADRNDWTGEYASWGGGQILLSYDAIMEYDSKDRITLQSHREWYNAGEDIVPVAEMKTVWTDNADGTYDSEMNSYLSLGGIDPDNMAYTNDQKQYQRYNANDSLIWDYQMMIDYVTEEMKPYYEDKYEYDENGNETYYASWNFDDAGERVPSIEERSTYDEDGNVIEQYFRSGDSGWKPIGAPSKKAPGHEEADDEGWVNTSHFTYSYENGVMVEKMNWRWDNAAGDWTPSTGSKISYDFQVPASELILPLTYGDPYKIDYMEEYMGDGAGGWAVIEKHYYYSEHNASVASQAAEGIRFADNRLTATGGERFEHSVYDVSGKLVYRGNAMTEDLSGLSKGVYIVKSKIDGAVSVLKIAVR